MNENDFYTKQESSSLTWRDLASPVLAVLLSVLFWAVFNADKLIDLYSPGLGIPVFVCAYFAVILLLLGKRARWGWGSAGLMGASVALSVSCFLWCDWDMTVLNCFAVLATAAAATFLFSGHTGSASTPMLFADTIRLSVFALFTRIPAPFETAKKAAKGRGASIGRALLGLLAALVLGIVVAALLASADVMFKRYINLENLQGVTFTRSARIVIRTIVLALFVCSGLFFIREPEPAAAEIKRTEKEKHITPWLMIAAVLDCIYILFCAVQFRYLFGGAENAAMAGGWAEYARTGFFQLVAVAIINLTVCLLSANKKRLALRGNPVLRIADGLMLALTAVILASAAYRMYLYIDAFGLSVLRLGTLWCMLVLLAGLVLAAIKLWKPELRVFPVLGAITLYSWCVFCLWGPSARAAEYNADAFLSGQLPTVDMDYLEELGGDATRALKKLASTDNTYCVAAWKLLDSSAGLSWTQYKSAYWR